MVFLVFLFFLFPSVVFGQPCPMFGSDLNNAEHEAVQDPYYETQRTYLNPPQYWTNGVGSDRCTLAGCEQLTVKGTGVMFTVVKVGPQPTDCFSPAKSAAQCKSGARISAYPEIVTHAQAQAAARCVLGKRVKTNGPDAAIKLLEEQAVAKTDMTAVPE